MGVLRTSVSIHIWLLIEWWSLRSGTERSRRSHWAGMSKRVLLVSVPWVLWSEVCLIIACILIIVVGSWGSVELLIRVLLRHQPTITRYSVFVSNSQLI